MENENKELTPLEKDLETLEEQKKGMSLLGKVVMGNLIVAVLYVGLLTGLMPKDDGGAMAGIMMGCYGMIVQAVLLFVGGVVAFIAGKNDWGKVLFITSGILLLVGFSTCFSVIMGALVTAH